MSATSALLCTGGINLDGQANAFGFDRTTGLYVGPTPITPAAIDAAGGMIDPLSTCRVVITA